MDLEFSEQLFSPFLCVPPHDVLLLSPFLLDFSAARFVRRVLRRVDIGPQGVEVARKEIAVHFGNGPPHFLATASAPA